MREPEIRTVSTEDCLPLRRVVLWPALTEDECRVPEDPIATHLGAVMDDGLVGCLSLCPSGPARIQLRKFAVASACQGRGIGARLMREAIETSRRMGAKQLVLDARSTAVGFYEKFGMKPEGEPFYKGPIEHYRMSIDL